MTEPRKPTKHHWEYCDHCEADVVICGTCGNNCCNGGYGEVMGPEPDTTMKCPDCPSAYELQNKGNIAYANKE
jgi:hypothetical protein